MKHLRLSPRILGTLNTENYCPRCLWYGLQLNFKFPFDRPMPAIMYNLDNFEKSLVNAHHTDTGKLPTWLSDLGAKSPVDFPAKLTCDFPDHNITMVGMPDAVFANAKGNLIVVDYKTAKHKGGNDPYLPIYKTQLLGYAYLLEQNAIGKVDGAALIYFENRLDEYRESPCDLLTEKGFSIPMGVALEKVDLDFDELAPLLDSVRKIADKPNPPEGLEKCRDCGRLEALLNMEAQMAMEQDTKAYRDNYFRRIVRPMLERDKRRALHAADGLEVQDQHLFPEVVADMLIGLLDFWI